MWGKPGMQSEFTVNLESMVKSISKVRNQSKTKRTKNIDLALNLDLIRDRPKRRFPLEIQTLFSVLFASVFLLFLFA